MRILPAISDGAHAAGARVRERIADFFRPSDDWVRNPQRGSLRFGQKQYQELVDQVQHGIYEGVAEYEGPARGLILENLQKVAKNYGIEVNTSAAGAIKFFGLITENTNGVTSVVRHQIYEFEIDELLSSSPGIFASNIRAIRNAIVENILSPKAPSSGGVH